MAHTNSASEGENLSRIKDILFGEDLQTIEQKLDIAKEENSVAFEKLKTELEDRFKKFELLLMEKTKEIVNVHEKNINTQKAFNDEIKQEIVNINLEVKNDKSNIENTISNNIEQFTDNISKLENAINQSIDKLKLEHETIVDELNKNKINKSTLADILNELAEKLKK